jgi:hypothetical protein
MNEFNQRYLNKITESKKDAGIFHFFKRNNNRDTDKTDKTGDTENLSYD